MRQRQLLMTGFVQEVFYRPILVLLSVVIWAIFASVCCGLTPFTVLSSAFLLIFFYYLLLRRNEIRPGVYLFLLFIIVALSATWFGVQRISARQTGFLKVKSLLAAGEGVKETVSGRITTFPQGFSDGWRLRLRPLNGRLAGHGEVLLYLPATVYDDSRLPLIDDTVTVQVELKPLKSARHPFLRGRLRNQVLSGLIAQGQVEDFSQIKIMTHSAGSLARVEKIRRSLYRALVTATGDLDSATILQAILIGCRDQLSLRIKELFLDFGVFHLFAISGLHLSVVVTLFFFLIKALIPDFLRRRLVKGTAPLAAGITILFLPGYILLAGLHLPVVRAGIMALFFLCALLTGRLRDPFSALFGAAVVILLIWPEALFALSFQLSFSAVATILWVVPRAREWWPRWLLPRLQKRSIWLQVFCRNLFYLSASSLAISLTTAPLLINRVHFISLYSLVANLLLIPLFSLLIIPLGMVSLMFVKLPGVMALLLKPLVMILAGLISVGVGLQEWLPPGRSYFAALTSFELILAFFIILTGCWLLTSSSRKKITASLLLLLFAMLFLDLGWWQYKQGQKKISVAAFVGAKPQALLFELPGGEAMLLNGGSWCGSSGSVESLAATSFFSFAKNVIAPYCWRRKLKRIDTLVLTEPQRGLVGGLLFLIEHFGVREIWYHGIWSGYPPFKNFCRISQDRFGVRWYKISSFSYPFLLNGVEIEIMGPPANDFRAASSTSKSLAGMAPSLLLNYGEFSALIWGGGQVDSALLPKRVDLLAQLRPCGPNWSGNLAAVAVKPGGWLLSPDGGREENRNYSDSNTWDLKREGFLFLETDKSGKLIQKLPASLLSGCQGWPDKL